MSGSLARPPERAGTAQTPSPASGADRPQRIGIFRRIAVERYSGVFEPHCPEQLVPWPRGALLVAVALALAAFWLLFG